MDELILKCDKLNKSFGKKKILKDVSFELYEGDILGFIGSNGAQSFYGVRGFRGMIKL